MRGARVDRLSDGRIRFESQLKPDAQFDFLRFRRSLYHVALNIVAGQDGASTALDPKFDKVRRYVRNPVRPDESWPFGQFEVPAQTRQNAGQFVDYGDCELVAVHIFRALFLVDLLQTGILASAVANKDLSTALGVGPGTYTGPEDKEPPPVTITATGTLKPQ
jgi:hypothetical protein